MMMSRRMVVESRSMDSVYGEEREVMRDGEG
jgi:hypothetical protein